MTDINNIDDIDEFLSKTGTVEELHEFVRVKFCTARQKQAIEGILKKVSNLAKENEDLKACYIEDKKTFESMLRRDRRLYNENNLLKEALKGDTDSEMKAKFIGEFSFEREVYDEDGNEVNEKIVIPWTTMKDIYRAMSQHRLIEISVEEKDMERFVKELREIKKSPDPGRISVAPAIFDTTGA